MLVLANSILLETQLRSNSRKILIRKNKFELCILKGLTQLTLQNSRIKSALEDGGLLTEGGG